jgi:hypothetical protein
MFDGIVRILTNVRYAPDLKKKIQYPWAHWIVWAMVIHPNMEL